MHEELENFERNQVWELVNDMNPLGFVPDLSMRGVGITRLKETTFTA
jgi:hypothetical protein